MMTTLSKKVSDIFPANTKIPDLAYLLPLRALKFQLNGTNSSSLVNARSPIHAAFII